jgi:hypothetical protein
MPEQLFRLGNTQWWVLVDTDRERILDQFNKPQLAATIAALETTVASQPDLTQLQQDYADLVALVKAQNITQERKDRVLQLLDNMYLALADSPVILDLLQVRERLTRLKAFIAKWRSNNHGHDHFCWVRSLVRCWHLGCWRPCSMVMMLSLLPGMSSPSMLIKVPGSPV